MNDMDTIEYAAFRYDTVEVENCLKAGFLPDEFVYASRRATMLLGHCLVPVFSRVAQTNSPIVENWLKCMSCISECLRTPRTLFNLYLLCFLLSVFSAVKTARFNAKG